MAAQGQDVSHGAEGMHRAAWPSDTGAGTAMPRQDLLPDGMLGVFWWSSCALCNVAILSRWDKSIREVGLSGNLMLDFGG